ncbi:4Fe-4S binding protein [Pseudoflavonifractor phocaeensis]|uniref:4Fe-4S binding protein n=1 Tax=Pseudoflavonifractor phocaeensis TaxID=1870988 RepID=UPI001959DC11|nr:4Fe-4S binding protein [Pseudoflavonifractor phocaeensis]MBM6927153.1 4Fe-4S binding protein [Pseudoflavonifractor phocaeensis]
MAPTRIKRIAVVYCTGGNRAKRRVQDDLTQMDCAQAVQAYPDGLLDCAQGCLGLGSCVAACRLKAIAIGPHGAALVDRDKCVGCGLCVKACPKSLIRLVDADTTITPRCSNQDAGPAARNACSVSCITCRICEKNCPADAITMEDNHAVIDPAKCISCGMCAVKCPRGVIVDADGVFTVNNFS